MSVVIPFLPMHRLLVPVAALILLLGPGSQQPQGQTGIAIPQAVTENLARHGRALVIVGLQSNAVPEGLLAGPADIQSQRLLLHSALNDVMARAEAAGALETRRFETIPYFTATVNDAGSLAALAALPGVVSITEDGLLAPDLIDSAPLIGAPAAWAAGGTGAGWSVAVLDTGVQSTHPFLSGRVTGEACFSDAGGAAFIGTSMCPGGASMQLGSGAAMDCELSTSGCGHGTHVAGIVAGSNGTGDLAGHSGIAPGAGILAVQVFTRIHDAGSCGSSPVPCARVYFSDLIRGLEWVLDAAGPGNSNRVAAANMSLGGGTYTSQAACDNDLAPVKRIVDQLRSVGIASVFSAGNAGIPDAIGAPGCISTAVSVGSTTKFDAVSSFSNRASFLSLMAPGSSIRSSVPGLGAVSDVYNGTSMAAPHVAGAWAILKQAAPGASVTHVLNALQSTGAAIPDGALTHARINVNAARTALVGISEAPGAPGAPLITGAGGIVTITVPPPTAGGPPTSYTIVARNAPDAPDGPIVAILPMGQANRATVSAPPGSYYVTAMAGNTWGNSPESAGTSITAPFVPPPPGAPSYFTVHFAGREVRMSWTAPATGGAPTSYVVLASTSPGGTPVATLPVTGTGLAVGNVPPGTYFIRVVAVNTGGVGPTSEELSVTIPATNVPPGPPTLLPVSMAGNLVTMNWFPSHTGGFPVSYTVRASQTSGGPVIASLTSTSTTLTVPAPPGTYYVRVVANNAHGTSTVSNERVITVLP